MGIKERWSRSKPLPPDILDRIAGLKVVFQHQGVRLAYLFGSLAKRREAQDVDLAVLPGVGDFGTLRQAVGEALGTERLDLVNLNKASPVLRFEIIRSGKLIHKADDQTENDFEMGVLCEYHDTAYLRARQARILKERTEQWLSKKKRSSKS